MIVVDLENLSPAEKHVALVVPLMVLLVQLTRRNCFFDLRDGLTCQD